MGEYKATFGEIVDDDGNVIHPGGPGTLYMPESFDIAFKVFDAVVREDIAARKKKRKKQRKDATS